MVDNIFLLVKKSCLHPQTGKCVDENHSLIYPLGAYILRDSADQRKLEVEKNFRIEHLNNNGSTPNLRYDVIPVNCASSIEDYIERVHLLTKKFCIRDSTGRCIDNGHNGVYYIKGYNSKESAHEGKLDLEERFRQECTTSYEPTPNIMYDITSVDFRD